jgi:hypothetical protein
MDPFTRSRDTPIEELLEVIREYGIVVIPQYVENEDERSALETEHGRILSMPKSDWINPTVKGRMVRVTRSGISRDRLPATAKFFNQPWMGELARRYLGRKNVAVNWQIFVGRDVVGSRSVASDLHFDVVRHFKYFYYATDTTVRNGAFTCIPGSHKLTPNIRRQRRITYQDLSTSRELPVEAAGEEVPIEGPTGTLIIFDTETFHRAGTVLEGERHIMRGHCK